MGRERWWSDEPYFCFVFFLRDSDEDEDIDEDEEENVDEDADEDLCVSLYQCHYGLWKGQ